MPAMVRPVGKSKKLAYSILGKPANMEPRTEREKEIDRRSITTMGIRKT
jgi:hypothetical protein